MRVANRISATKTLTILDNQWLSTKDIMALGTIGMAKALKLKHKITKEVEEKGFLLPSGLVPTRYVVEALGIDIKYLKKLSMDKPNPNFMDGHNPNIASRKTPPPPNEYDGDTS